MGFLAELLYLCGISANTRLVLSYILMFRCLTSPFIKCKITLIKNVDYTDRSPMEDTSASSLLEFIDEATSPYHVVAASVKRLKTAGFKELDVRKPWNLAPLSKYYTIPYETSLFAFTTGDAGTFDHPQSLHLAAAHTDSPCLHIKPKAELDSKGGYLRLNTDIYGGPILNTWLDRPLSIAGRVALKSSDIFHPVLSLIDVRKPVLTIPNLAIHMNREVNKGVELSRQEDMLPLLSIIDKSLNSDNYFVNFIADILKVSANDILDFDLYVYNSEQGCFTGMKDEFISCPRLDNLTSCLALINAVINGRRSSGIDLIGLYDNEEIGSRTKQGADSSLLLMILEKVYASFNKTRAELNTDILGSYLMSVDVAHALHPNTTKRYDPVNTALMNSGVVFKLNSNQRYATDNEAVAIAQQLCAAAGVSYKKFVNNSDVQGGGTLGPLISSWLPMKTLDIGVPILAMHSARELMGRNDQLQLENLVTAFFSTGE